MNSISTNDPYGFNREDYSPIEKKGFPLKQSMILVATCGAIILTIGILCATGVAHIGLLKTISSSILFYSGIGMSITGSAVLFVGTATAIRVHLVARKSILLEINYEDVDNSQNDSHPKIS